MQLLNCKAGQEVVPSQSKLTLKHTIAAGVVFALCTLSTHADTNLSVQKHTTPAGHAFWYFPMPNAERTALAINWAQEVPLGDNTHPAVAILGTEVMLKGGAGGRDAADIVADYEDLDAGSGLWVQPRSATGFITAPNKHFAKAREIAQQVLSAPAMEQRWIEREQQAIIESALDDRANSWGLAYIIMREVYLADHPYNKIWSFNSLDDFKEVTTEDVTQWYESSFSTKTATVTVAGSADAETIGKEIDLLFAELPDIAPSKSIEMEKPSAPGKTILFHNPDAPKSVVVLAGNFPQDNEQNSTALQLGVGVLGHSRDSRLFKAVRAGMGASYGFGAEVFDVTQDYRMLAMNGEIETDKLKEALDEIEKAYTEFVSSGIGRLEFPIAKRFYKREIKKELQRPVVVAFELTEGIRNGFSVDYINTTLDRIDSLDRSSVNKLISDTFPKFENMVKLIVSPDADAVDGACVITKIEQARGCLE